MSDANPNDPLQDSPAHGGRRRFCKAVIGGTAAASAATTSYPIVAFLRLPKALGPVELLEVSVEDLVDGEGYWGEHRGKQIVVIKQGDEIRAFDGECSHLGCIVRWDSADQVFKCPCHGAKFDALGNPIAGPANAPLRRVTFVVEEGVLKVTDISGST